MNPREGEKYWIFRELVRYYHLPGAFAPLFAVSSQIQLCTIKPAAMAILSRKENTSKHVRLPFTKTEEAALRKGVELHGTGSWAVILGSGHFATQRTNIDLKDKWRNLNKKRLR